MIKLSNIKNTVMKKYAILFLLLSGCVTIGSVSEVTVNKDFPHNEVQKMAVIMFETPIEDKGNTMHNSKSAISPNAGAILADMTANELIKWGKYVIVDRKGLEEDLELKNLREEDFLHTENYSGLGRSLGVDAVVVGKVEDFGFSYKSLPSGLILSLVTKVTFTARCLDVTTNETIWAVNIKGTSRKNNERVLASELITKAIETLKTKLN
jgi:curli biogenesis system outer membrane secretion channel CsgG